MYIGKLNDLKFTYTKKDSSAVPESSKDGKLLNISWDKLTTGGVDLYFNVPEKCLVNTVVMTLGEKCTPKSVSAYTEGKERLIYTYHGETGKAITEKKVVLEIEESISEFVIEIESGFSDAVIENIDVYGANFEGETLFPTPLKYKDSGKNIDISVLDSFDGDIMLSEILSKKLNVKREKNGRIRFLTDDDIKSGGYSLSVAESGITVKASDRRGFVQGAETVVKLVKDGKIPCCEIKDEPFCDFRGVHLYLPAESEMEFAKRFIKYILSPFGYNYIILEIAGAMQFESHPEINKEFEHAVEMGKKGEWPKFPHGGVGGGKTVSKAAVRDFCEYARRFGIEVIPEIQSLGHVQFMTLAHPDIAERAEEDNTETDERNADTPPSAFYAHSFCPSNPKSYEILFDIADEIIDTVSPKEYVHMGHDEVYQIGICPKCKDKDPAVLFAEDINKLYDYLTGKGLKMMIWADMLHPKHKNYKTSAAIDMIPKDIVLLDFVWYFHIDDDIEDNLLDKGFDVIIGNLYSSYFSRYESRIRKPRMLGGEVSTWVATCEDSIAREGKFYDILYTAQMLWSESYTGYTRYSYDKLISGLIPRLREQIRGVPSPALSEGTVQKEIEADNVNEYCKSIIFEHYASKYIRRIPWVDLEKIGVYKVCFEDGSITEIPVTYSGNIGWQNRRPNEPFNEKYYRHNGYCASSWYTDGVQNNGITLYRYEWINPKPDVMITKIELENTHPDTEVIVNKITTVE